MGTAGGSGSGPRTWDTLAQPAETHPRTHNLASTQLTSRKKQILAFWLVLVWLTGLAGLAAAPLPGYPTSILVAEIRHIFVILGPFLSVFGSF